VSTYPLPDTPGRLADNIAHFGRALRKAGVPVGPAHILAAVHAVEAAGFSEREDFYHTLLARPAIHRKDDGRADAANSRPA